MNSRAIRLPSAFAVCFTALIFYRAEVLAQTPNGDEILNLNSDELREWSESCLVNVKAGLAFSELNGQKLDKEVVGGLASMIIVFERAAKASTNDLRREIDVVIEGGSRDPSIIHAMNGDIEYCASNIIYAATRALQLEGEPANNKGATGTIHYKNKDIIGSDLTDEGIHNISETSCEEICRSSKDCRAYSYVVEKDWCWPKFKDGNLVPRFGVNSGVVGGEYSSHRSAPDAVSAQQKSPKNANPSDGSISEGRPKSPTAAPYESETWGKKFNDVGSQAIADCARKAMRESSQAKSMSMEEVVLGCAVFLSQ